MKKLITPLKSLMVLLVASLSLSACSKKVEQPELPAPQTVMATPYGTAWLVDKYGHLENNYEGINVNISGNGINRNTTTGRDGRFEFKEIPAGNYRVTYEKDGYESTVQMATVFGYDYIQVAVLGPKATHEIFIEEARIQNDKIVLNMTSNPVAASTKPIGYIVFASNSPNVDVNNALYFRATNAEVLIDQNLSLSEIQKSGIDVDAPIYLALYPKTFYVSQSNDHGLKDFPTINKQGKKVIQVIK
ncbi:MAG: carboxypeptidase-like regulatory domain-containing protein [Chitinophagia bacterium]|jgi:hypothetical protein